MNVLCGKVKRTSGTLEVAGKEAEVHQFRSLIGYVPQEDVMLRELTVREVLLHSARVRLPDAWTSKQISEYVDNLLIALNLSHVQHSPIGDEVTRGVSGGTSL
jgi:ABC-type multidrug transport system ATPase subunit